VVVVLTERLVIDDIEIRRGEWLRAGAAGKALLVPATGQATVGRFDGFSFDALVASAADGPGSWRVRATNAGRLRLGVRVRGCEGRWRSDLERAAHGGGRCGTVRVEVTGWLGRRCWLCRRWRHGLTRAGVGLQGDWLRYFEVGVPGLIVGNTGTVFRINR